MKKNYFLIALWLIAFGMLFSQLYYWGGIAHTPVVGAIAKERAKFSSPLMAAYIFLGDKAVGLTGLAGSAVNAVSAQTQLLHQSLLKNRSSAPRELRNQLPSSKVLSYYLAPILLVACLLLQLRKPKQISTFSRQS
jgi:hypothetical protein